MLQNLEQFWQSKKPAVLRPTPHVHFMEPCCMPWGRT